MILGDKYLLSSIRIYELENMHGHDLKKTPDPNKREREKNYWITRDKTNI